MSSCGSHEEYDAYVETLKAQPVAIDTISSRSSYAAYLESLTEIAKAFDQLGIKLDQTQKDQLTACSEEIQAALTAKYELLEKQSQALSSADAVVDVVSEELVDN